MLGAWSKNPKIKVVVAVVIVATLLSFLVPLLRREDGQRAQKAEQQLYEAVGFVVAEEVAKILGSEGGGVALILVTNGGETLLENSPAALYERGFKKAIEQNRSLQFLGHHLVAEPSTQNEYATFQWPATLLAARNAFAEAKILVSFIGLPQLSEEEIAAWLESNPPPLMVMENVPPDEFVIQQLLQRRVVARILLRSQDILFAQPQPELTPRQLVDRFYRVQTQ